MTPGQRYLRSRIASYRKWANTADPTAATAPARAPEMIDVMDQTFKEPAVPIAFLGGVFWPIGGVLLGIVIWRSQVLWKWGGLLLIVSSVVGIPAFLDQKAFQLIGTPLSGLAMVVIGVDLWRSASE